MKSTPWLVVGAGAIGLLWSCRLNQLGYQVHLVYRKDAPDMPLLLDSPSEDNASPTELRSEHVIPSFKAEELPLVYDKVLLCTKSYDVINAYSKIKQHLSNQAIVACLCNGMGIQEALYNTLTAEQCLWAGTTTEGAFKITTNHVKQTGLGNTYFGPWSQKKTEIPFPLSHLTVVDIQKRLIEKLAINAIINPITALFSIQNGDLLSKEFSILLKAALLELSELFTHPEFGLFQYSQHLTLNNLATRVATVAKLTQLNRSSMHEDVRFNRPTENEFISGFLLKNSPIPLTIQALLYEAIENSNSREGIKKRLLEIP